MEQPVYSTPSPSGPPAVAVLLLNWNSRDYTLGCLESLRQVTYPKECLGIFLCDNASTDGSTETLPKALEDMRPDGWRDLQYISSMINLGFGGGNNHALKRVPEEYPYLFLANNDLLFFQDTFQPLIETLETHPEAAAAGPRVLSFPPDNSVAHGAGHIESWCCRPTWTDCECTTHCDFLTGCALLIRRDTLAQAGGLFDERFFAYWEDTDLCLRLRKAGGKILYCPASQVRHKGGASTEAPGGVWRTPARLYYETHGRTLFARTHLSPLRFAFFLAQYALRIPLLAVRSLHERPADTCQRLRACMHGLADGVRGRPGHAWK